MPELVRIVLSQFVKFGLVFVAVYGVYRLIAFIGCRVTRRFTSGGNETWDGIQLLYRVPSSILGFISLDLVIVFVVSGIVSGCSKGHYFYFTNEFTDLFWILGVTGIFGATVFGIYRDEPAARFKILGCVAIGSEM